MRTQCASLLLLFIQAFTASHLYTKNKPFITLSDTDPCPALLCCKAQTWLPAKIRHPQTDYHM